MTGDDLLQSRSKAWSRSRRVLRRIWKHQNCSALTWHCISNHWRTVPPSRSCGTARTHNISSQRNAAEDIIAGKARHFFLPTIFQSRPVRETRIVGAASSRDRGRSVSDGSQLTWSTTATSGTMRLFCSEELPSSELNSRNLICVCDSDLG